MDFVSYDNLIKKFFLENSYLSDHIFLFYIDKKTTDVDYKKWFLYLDYPNVNFLKWKENELKKDYNKLLLLFDDVEFESDFLKVQYQKKLGEIWNILELINCFYDKNEEKKFHLVTKSFWVDLDFCREEVLKNQDLIINYFSDLLIESKKYDVIFSKIQEFVWYTFNSTQIKFYFEEALKYLKISDFWDVEITNNVWSIVHWGFTNNKGVIYIPSDANVSFERLFNLIIHEIDWHAKQFSNFSSELLFSSLVRFSNSEEYIEWLAMYLENSFNTLIFRNLKVKKYIDKFSQVLWLLDWKIDYYDFLEQYEFNKFRVFRGFSDIKNYINTKDLIYTQGLYKILKKQKDFGKKLFDVIYLWCVNDDYLLENLDKSENKFDIFSLIENSSAFFVMNKFFLKLDK